MDRFLTERRFVALVFLLFAAITLITTLHHEAWGDETDVWLVARDGGLGPIVDSLSYRGTPILWFLAVWPFAALGAPYLAQQLVNLAFAWAAVLLFLRFAPFPRLSRALFAFSYYAAFEYAVVARPYALFMLLLFLIARGWESRERRPMAFAIPVALVANTTSPGLIVGAVAGLLYLADAWRVRKVAWPAIVTMLAGGLASVAQLWPREGGPVAFSHVTVDTLWYTLTNAFFPKMWETPGLVLAIVAFLILTFAIARRPVALSFLMLSLVPILLVYVYIWMGGLRHAGIVTLLVIASLWIAKSYGPLRAERVAVAVLNVALGWSVLVAFAAWRSEWRHAYSGSRDAAAYLRHEAPTAQLVARGTFAESVLAYLPGRRFWYAGLNDDGTYAKWDEAFSKAESLPMETCIARAKQKFRGRKWLLVTTAELPPLLARQFRLRYHTERPVWVRFDEHYWVYEPLAGP